MVLMCLQVIKSTCDKLCSTSLHFFNPSATLLSNPVIELWNRASLWRVHLSPSFLEPHRCQNNTQSTILTVVLHKSTQSHLSADVSSGFMAVIAILIDQLSGLQLFLAQRSWHCSSVFPPNKQQEHNLMRWNMLRRYKDKQVAVFVDATGLLLRQFVVWTEKCDSEDLGQLHSVCQQLVLLTVNLEINWVKAGQ